jgi:hypothetical protein
MGLCRSALFPLSSTPILMRWFATRLMSMHNVHLAFMLHCHLLDWSTACTGLLERSRGTLGEPQRTSDSRRHGTVWYCKTNETLLRTRTYLGRDPTGPLAPLGGTESLLHSPPPPKWERPRSQSQNLLCDLLLNLLPNLPLLESINLQLPRSGS